MHPVPSRLLESCRISPERMAWLARLPETITDLEQRWQLSIGAPFDADASWAAPVIRGDTKAVLKIGMPHMEAEHEADGLRFWNGNPTVRLLDADDDLGVMLLERCEPGTPLSDLPEKEQDVVVGSLLRRMWKAPPAGHRFRPLSEMIESWISETLTQRSGWPDEHLVRAGIDEFRSLAGSSPTLVLLATDLHAGNVLRAERVPWLVIDPKPFVGDPAYDATQHLLNCLDRVRADPRGVIARCAELMELDPERIRRWLFARLAAEPREDCSRDRYLETARVMGRRF